MRKLLALLLIVAALTTAKAQKQMEIPQTDVVAHFVKQIPEHLSRFGLDDLRYTTDSLVIRIWKTNEILTLKASGAKNYQYTFFMKEGNTFVQEKTDRGTLPPSYWEAINSIGFSKIENDNDRGIDGSYVFFEISTQTSYKICSIWSPSAERNANGKRVVQILDLTNEQLKATSLRHEFIENLAPNTYQWGMGTINIDRFLDQKVPKTDFYRSAEERIRRELNITDRTSHQNYPLIIINEKLAHMAALNSYSQKEIVSFEIFKPNSVTAALYGTSGSFGVVKVKTK